MCFKKCVKKLVFHQSTVTALAPSSVYSILPPCIHPGLLSCTCVFFSLHCDACWKPSALRVGVKTLHNTIQWYPKGNKVLNADCTFQSISSKCSCEIRKALNIDPLLQFESSQLRWFGHVSRMSHKRLSRQLMLAAPTGKRFSGRQGPGGVPISQTSFGPVLVWSKQNYQRLLLNMRYWIRFLLGRGWAISGPRATCGPPQHFQWHHEAFKKNLQIWTFLRLVTVLQMLALRITRTETWAIRRYGPPRKGTSSKWPPSQVNCPSLS